MQRIVRGWSTKPGFKKISVTGKSSANGKMESFPVTIYSVYFLPITLNPVRYGGFGIALKGGE